MLSCIAPVPLLPDTTEISSTFIGSHHRILHQLSMNSNHPFVCDQPKIQSPGLENCWTKDWLGLWRHFEVEMLRFKTPPTMSYSSQLRGDNDGHLSGNQSNQPTNKPTNGNC